MKAFSKSFVYFTSNFTFKPILAKLDTRYWKLKVLSIFNERTVYSEHFFKSLYYMWIMFNHGKTPPVS